MGDLDLSGKIFGNSRLIRLIGQGGFASVYEGEHIHLGIRIAVKLLKQRISDEEEERKNFLGEAQIIANLDHPHIIRLIDYSVQDDRPFLVMEYAPGGTLSSLHTRGEILELSSVVSYIKQIASALQYAHNQNVIHRDVKPNNMLVKANGEILLSDFGIAIMSSTSNLDSLPVVGTLSFIAPEQILGQPRYASDQYALAICAYLWLCGTYPFQGSSQELMFKHLHAEPLSPRKVNPTLPVQVEHVLLKALAKKPEDRFLSVEMFSRSLEQACRGNNIIFPLLQEHQKLEPTILEETLSSATVYQTVPAQLVPVRRNASPIISGLRFLVRLPIYLLFVPLLILLTPLLLLYYYGIRILHKPTQVNNTMKRLSPLVVGVSSLHLPKGFWPTKLLVGVPNHLQPSMLVVTTEDITSTHQVEIVSEVKGRPKRLWQLAVQFVLRGPTPLRGEVQNAQSLYGYQHALHPTGENNQKTFISGGPKSPTGQLLPPFAGKIGSQSSVLEENSISTKGRKSFCVLYHHNDRSWAEWIAWLLEEDGLSTIMPDWDFRVGYNIAKETCDAINKSQRVIVIISPDYLDDHNTQWGFVFSKEMLSREGGVLPIIARDCGTQLKKPLDTLVSINLVGRDILHTSEKLRKAVRLMRSKPTNPPIFPPDALHQQINTTDRQQSKSELVFNSNQQKDGMSGEPIRGIPLTDPLATKRFDTSDDGRVVTLSSQTNLIESAFKQKDWPDVIRKSKWLIQQSPPGSVAWKIYRMQALAYHAQGKVMKAREALETALALVSDKRERLALLDEYTNALAVLKHWQEMLIYAEEALTLVPDDIRWQALRDQITMRIDLEESSNGEEPFFRSVAMDLPKEDQAKSETMQEIEPKAHDNRTRVLSELSFDQSMRDEEKTVLPPSTPIDIFIAYSPADRDLCIDLKNQLTSLEHQYQLAIRYDHDISAGKERIKSTEEHLKKAQIIILLLSAYFLGSDYHRWQINLALKRSQESATRIIPVLLRPSDWEKTSLGRFQALPRGNRAVTTCHDRDEAFLSVVQGIRQAVEELQSTSSS